MNLLITVLCGFVVQVLVSCTPRDTNQRLTINSDEYYTRFRPYNAAANDKLLPPHTNTEYRLKTVQTGSVYIPPRHKGPVHVSPNHNLTKTYLSRVDTTIHHIPALHYRRPSNYTHTAHRRGLRHRAADCIRCPQEKILIAKRGLDGVLVEPPKLMSCHNRAVVNGLFQMETLFGHEFNFLLPHGTHSFHGKIRNKRSGKHETTCLLRYKVIVQQCGRYYPMDKNLRVKCDLGSIWGSKCYFSCRKGRLTHNKPMVCGDSLEWEGDEPECTVEHVRRSNTACDFLSIPDNGRFSCQYPANSTPDDYNNDLTSPNGTICRIKCNRNYEIPLHLEQFNVFQCNSGRWNTTINHLCQPKLRKRVL